MEFWHWQGLVSRRMKDADREANTRPISIGAVMEPEGAETAPLVPDVSVAAESAKRRRALPKSGINSWQNDALQTVMPALFNIPRRAERRSGEAIRRTFVD